MAVTTDTIPDRIAADLMLAANGDDAAFTRIVADHHRDMTRVAYLVAGDLDVADEAVAAAWAIAWRKLGSVREPDRLRPWLVSVAANEARQLVRRQRRRAVREIPMEAATQVATAGLGGPSADLDLVRALSLLPADDRALLSLRYVAGLTSIELASATGRSASGTRVRLKRLLGRLRTELADV